MNIQETKTNYIQVKKIGYPCLVISKVKGIQDDMKLILRVIKIS